jgi:peptide/nickel transport system substrate-binding protein
MKRITPDRSRWTAAAAVVLLVVAALAAATVSARAASSHSSAGTSVTVDTSSPPNSIDPQSGYTVSAGETDWLVYTPLLTYAHKSGVAGTQLIPGLATALPTVTNRGKTYMLTLRPGLKYSDGKPVAASDVQFAIQRAIKVNWGASSFLMPIAGAQKYLDGKADSISGIKTNDKTRTVTFTLTTPVGDFANVLAFPATAPVPQSTPMTVQTTDMPPGVGPYMFQNVVPNQSYEIVKNPLFASFHIPGIPLGSIDTIKTVIVSNNLTEAEDVLANRVDAFDVGDAVPATLLGQIQSQASSRFAKQTVASTNYFFLNQRIAPFNNILARQAAAYAIDRTALARLAGGFVAPSCYFIPVGIVGHPTAPCPYKSPNIAKARALLKKAHLLGAKISVYAMAKSPRQEEGQYYASALKQAGFNPQLKLINPAIYWTTIGNAKTRAQTGMGGQFLDFPAPDDFLLLIDARNIHPVKSNNFGNVNDRWIQKRLVTLEAVPATKLSSIAKQWAAVDIYQAKKAYTIVWGSSQLVKFFSDRIDFKSAVFHPLFFNDYSTWRLSK